MKQVVLDKRDGKLLLTDLPISFLLEKGVLVQTTHSLISSGTELAMILRAREGKIGQIKRMMPDDGIISYIKRKISSGTLVKSTNSIALSLNKGNKSGFGNLIPLGYSSAGVVVEKSVGIDKVNVNDKVACAGARHAGYNYVPLNLFSKVEQSVDLKDAAFTTVGCIALQGVRRANILLGETVVIVGQGIIGQICSQLVRCSGGMVIATDLSQWRLNKAKSLGADYCLNTATQDVVREVIKITGGRGADKVIICAATSSAKPIKDAIAMSRVRGRIVLVGVVGIQIPREPFYEKELDFVISRSYGPGRYDPLFEEKGYDYPLEQVRWTETRNMEEILRLLAVKKLDVKSLITHEFSIDQASEAYESIINNPNETLGVLFNYHNSNKSNLSGERKMFNKVKIEPLKDKIKTAIIGCGNFARKYHLPNIQKIDQYQLLGVVTATGLKAKEIAQTNAVNYCATDPKEVFSDPDIDLVVIATRHNLHASQAEEALKAGKHVFVEKPMALNLQELSNLVKTIKKSDKKYTIGFNRRFAPLIKEAKEIFKSRNTPMIINYRVANTFTPAQSWIHDAEVGGGTIIGECCHFFDLIYWLTEEEPLRIFAEGGNLTHPGSNIYDNTVITIRAAKGSIATITFTDQASEDFPKERIEIFLGNDVLVIEDFKKLTVFGANSKEHALKGSDKGHFEQFVQLADCIKNDLEPKVNYKDGVRATICSLKTIEALKSHVPQSIDLIEYI